LTRTQFRLLLELVDAGSDMVTREELSRGSGDTTTTGIATCWTSTSAGSAKGSRPTRTSLRWSSPGGTPATTSVGPDRADTGPCGRSPLGAGSRRGDGRRPQHTGQPLRRTVKAVQRHHRGHHRRGHRTPARTS
jgi:hypothetical protein